MSKGKQFSTLSGGNIFGSTTSDSRARSNTFQAANIATITTFSTPVNSHMPEFCCCTASSFHDLAIDDHTTTNASTHGEVNHIFTSLTCAKHVLSQSCYICIVPNQNGHIVMLFENVM